MNEGEWVDYDEKVNFLRSLDLRSTHYCVGSATCWSVRDREQMAQSITYPRNCPSIRLEKYPVCWAIPSAEKSNGCTLGYQMK